MKLLVTAPNITKPTYQTLEEYALKKVSKLSRIIDEYSNEDFEIRISVEKVKYLFNLTIQIFQPQHIVVKTQDKDLRKAIDLSVDTLVREVNKYKEKLQGK